MSLFFEGVRALYARITGTERTLYDVLSDSDPQVKSWFESLKIKDIDIFYQAVSLLIVLDSILTTREEIIKRIREIKLPALRMTLAGLKGQLQREQRILEVREKLTGPAADLLNMTDQVAARVSHTGDAITVRIQETESAIKELEARQAMLATIRSPGLLRQYVEMDKSEAEVFYLVVGKLSKSLDVMLEQL
jgi:hypothetical protein